MVFRLLEVEWFSIRAEPRAVPAPGRAAPKCANLDKVNPGSVIVSGEMMFRYMGWNEVAELVLEGMDAAIGEKTVAYDFNRLMDGAMLLKCSELGDAIIKNM